MPDTNVADGGAIVVFTTVLKAPIPIRCVGWIVSPIPNWQGNLYASAFPLIDVTVMPDDEIMQHRRMALLELIQKHIRQRDLMGLVEQMACLLSSGYANDRQIKGLFNYILQTGDAVRF